MAEKICRNCGSSFRKQKRGGTARFAGRVFCSRDCWRAGIRAEWERRFWANVQKGESCWLWRGRVGNSGYGAVTFRNKPTNASRVALEITGRPSSNGLFVLHSCDNKLCVNPAHLRWGTAQENADDRESRGRGIKPQGERHGQAKLTEDRVRYIRSSGRPPREMAREFGVSDTVVYLARQGRTWRHVQ
jgi:hypothetical protein